MHPTTPDTPGPAEVPARVADRFVEMAHRIVWASVATVDEDDRPWSRILHPIWGFDGERLTGWIATVPTGLKRRHLAHSPHLSVNYWTPDHDTCSAECRASWITDRDELAALWERFAAGPEPVGYDPSIVPAWDSPESEAFGGLRLDPWRLRVFPGTVLLRGEGEVLTWVA